MQMIHDETFLSGIYIVLNGYTMAVLSFMVFALHAVRARHEKYRRLPRFWKGATYFMLGIGFIISEQGVMSVENVRRMLRLIVALLLWAEIAYHSPDILACWYGWRRKRQGEREKDEWTQLP